MVTSLAVTPDGLHFISGSGDQLVKVWSVATKSLVSTCRGHTDTINVVAAMPDGQRFLSGSGGSAQTNDPDYTVRVWLLDGTLQNTFELHTEDVEALVAMPDNQHALSGSADATVKLFNVNDGAVLRTFWLHTLVLDIALLPDGRRFACGGWGDAYVLEHGLAPW